MYVSDDCNVDTLWIEVRVERCASRGRKESVFIAQSAVALPRPILEHGVINSPA